MYYVLRQITDELRFNATLEEIRVAVTTHRLRTLGDSAPYAEVSNSELEKQTYYKCNTEKDADALASFVASRLPGSKWLVLKATSVFFAPPGSVAKTVINEKGATPQ